MGIKNYSQNNEQEIISNYFGSYNGTLLSLGENDGITLSNALSFIDKGWAAVLVEPATDAFNQLKQRHIGNNKVLCYNFAISDYCGKSVFYDSGTHLGIGDKSLLSSLNKNEISKWMPTTTFQQATTDVIDFKTLLALSAVKEFDFISIDCEGEDIKILRQINLSELGCRLLCVEHNGHYQVFEEIKSICKSHGLHNMLLKNGENVIWSI